MSNSNKQLYIILFVLALIVNFAGINDRFFTDDPALYASISKNLLYHHTFFELFTYNRDWLDKPHFPFWAVLFSFKIFGVSVWAYRLPALLFFMLSLLYTWLFSKKFYGTETAWIAMLILATAQHLIMSNTDVRAEPYLMALIIGAIYHISRLKERYALPDLLLAALLTACAIMTKGIFVIVAIYGALLGQLIFQKKGHRPQQVKWILLLLLTFIFTLPEFYALYVQFDLHPEKVVFNKTNVSGIRWFLWDSQFGRFASSGPITRSSSDVLFYMHTLLWAFAPWCLLFYYSAYENIKAIIMGKKRREYYTISGGMVLLLLFSVSRFQLPFYTNAIFPLFAIITAPVCHELLSHFGMKFRQVGLWPYIALLPIAVLSIQYFSRSGHITFFIADIIIFGTATIVVLTKSNSIAIKTFSLACIASLFANFYLNTVFYQELADYKGEIKAADYANQKMFDPYQNYVLSPENNIFQFYSKKQVSIMPPDSFKNFKPQRPVLFYVNYKMMSMIHQMHADFKVVKGFPDYPRESIQPAFINRDTRNQVLDSVYLITK